MKTNWLRSLSIELREARVISEQAKHGWLFDTPKAYELLGYVLREMERVDAELRPQLPRYTKRFGVTIEEPFYKGTKKSKKKVLEWGIPVVGAYSRVYFEEMNLGSDAQVKDFLLTLGWKPTFWNYRKKDSVNGKKGEKTSPKLQDNKELCPNLDELDGAMAKSLVLYLKLKHRKGLLEGLLKVVREDGRISGEADTIGTATHRMSHKKIVNIPGCDAFLGDKLRALFIAPEGYSILGVDSKSNQIRMLCHYMNDDDYTEAALNGDIHSENQRIAGLSTRADAKTFIYGFLFGAGDEKIGRIVGGTSRHGKALKDTFLTGLPKLRTLVNAVTSRVERVGYIHSLDGRRIYVSSTHKSLNYLLQGAEAVYMKYAQCFLWKWIKEEGLDAHFVATVHDEFQLEVRDDQIDRVTELALKAMLLAGEHLDIRVPMEGDAKVGKSWADTH